MTVFKGIRFNENENEMHEAPEDMIFAACPEDYFDSDMFYVRFMKFVNVIPSKRDVLLRP
jgi:hypothetical protein